jgi:hypothetical protein
MAGLINTELEKEFETSGHDLIEVLSWHLQWWCHGQDSN